MRNYLILSISVLTFAFLAACGNGEEVAILLPKVTMSQELAESIDQINFWIYGVMDKNDKPLTCERLMLEGEEAIDPNDSLYERVYQNTMVFYQDRQNTKTYQNIPAGSNYLLYARGYRVVSANTKTMQAQACAPNISIKADETTLVQLTLKAASAN